MKQKIDNSSGFTLIEVLIAAAIIAFGMLAMGSFLGSLVNKNAANERKTMATALAESKIEDLRNDAANQDSGDFDATDSNTVGRAINRDGVDVGVSGAVGSDEMYTLTWLIVEDFAGLADGIQVTVDWDGLGNSQVTARTLVNN